MQIDGREIDIGNRNKPFFPDTGLTKGDLVDYYHAVAPVMVPHLRDYGVSMERYPDGIDGKSFFQKDAPDYFPDWLTTVTIPRREGGSFAAPVIDSAATLVYLADQAMLTPHLYLSRSDDLEHPDRMLFDLDPPANDDDSTAVRRAARELREILAELELPCYLQTSGSQGFHLLVPLRRGPDFDTVRAFAADVTQLLVRRHPERYTRAQRKEKRTGRIFLDTLRNAYGATAVAPYAVRALSGAPVATPLEWEELDGTSPQRWTLHDIPRRLAQKDDPWAEMRRHARDLESRRDALNTLLEVEDPADEES